MKRRGDASPRARRAARSARRPRPLQRRDHPVVHELGQPVGERVSIERSVPRIGSGRRRSASATSARRGPPGPPSVVRVDADERGELARPCRRRGQRGERGAEPGRACSVHLGAVGRGGRRDGADARRRTPSFAAVDVDDDAPRSGAGFVGRRRSARRAAEQRVRRVGADGGGERPVGAVELGGERAEVERADRQSPMPSRSRAARCSRSRTTAAPSRSPRIQATTSPTPVDRYAGQQPGRAAPGRRRRRRSASPQRGEQVGPARLERRRGRRSSGTSSTRGDGRVDAVERRRRCSSRCSASRTSSGAPSSASATGATQRGRVDALDRLDDVVERLVDRGAATRRGRCRSSASRTVSSASSDRARIVVGSIASSADGSSANASRLELGDERVRVDATRRSPGPPGSRPATASSALASIEAIIAPAARAARRAPARGRATRPVRTRPRARLRRSSGSSAFGDERRGHRRRCR